LPRKPSITISQESRILTYSAESLSLIQIVSRLKATGETTRMGDPITVDMVRRVLQPKKRPRSTTLTESVDLVPNNTVVLKNNPVQEVRRRAHMDTQRERGLLVKAVKTHLAPAMKRLMESPDDDFAAKTFYASIQTLLRVLDSADRSEDGAEKILINIDQTGGGCPDPGAHSQLVRPLGIVIQSLSEFLRREGYTEDVIEGVVNG